MRFQKYPRTKHEEPSNRRIAAAKKAVAREADAMALYPELRRDTDAMQRIERIDRGVAAWIQDMRDQEAHTWRYARKIYRLMPPEMRGKIDWDSPGNPRPAKPYYLADQIYQMARQLAHTVPPLRICCDVVVMGYIPTWGWYCPVCKKEEKI